MSEDEILDWDFHIDPPAPDSSGTIEVKLLYGGESKPIPFDDPWATDELPDSV